MSAPTRCPTRARHWRIAWGTVGIRTPVCVYCGSPNPKPLTDDEWDNLIDWVQHWRQSQYVRDAIETHNAH